MKLFIEQKVFSFTDKFSIKDEFENIKYYVYGEFLSWGHELHVLNAFNEEVAFIKEKVMSFTPKFEVYLHGDLQLEIKKEYTFFTPKYTINGVNWTVSGDIWDHIYSISDGISDIVTIRKSLFSFGDYYEIDILDGVDEILAISAVLAIDCDLEKNQ